MDYYRNIQYCLYWNSKHMLDLQKSISHCLRYHHRRIIVLMLKIDTTLNSSKLIFDSNITVNVHLCNFNHNSRNYHKLLHVNYNCNLLNLFCMLLLMTMMLHPLLLQLKNYQPKSIAIQS